MRLIAKRGLWQGANKEKENTIEQIKLAISKGFDVEVDCRLTPSGWFLGHDEPQEKVDIKFFDHKSIWTHCKSRESYDKLIRSPFVKAFCHQDEDMAYVSNSDFIWQHGRFGKFVYQNTTRGRIKAGLYRDDFRLQNIFCDVDGVMGRVKAYDKDHNCISKEFNDKDFTALKRFKTLDLNVILISGDKWNEGMAKERELLFIHSDTIGRNSKLNTLKRLGFNLESSSYIGDDVYDCNLLNAVGYPFCPKDALQEIQNESIVLDRASGEGCIASMYEWLVQRGIIEKVFPNEG